MARRFLVGIPLLTGLVPLAGHALGLGEIELRSALNQPFAADIPLALDPSDDPAAVQVRLAPPETFARFGLDRPAFLADLRFAVDAGAGSPVIRVASGRPVSEPFVSILVEVTWPKGRLLREYTVLLDPPAFAAPAVPPVAAPAAGLAPRVVERAPAPAPPPAVPPPAAAGDDGSTYGPVQPNETLWVIASRVRPDAAVTVNQAMLALFRANPEAFAGNINRLRAGAILRVPAAGEMAAISGADAEVRAQMASWRASLPAVADDPGARLQLVPPAESVGATPADAGREARLESELREARRLLEVRNREFQALQQRLGEGAPTAPPAAVPPPPVADAAPETAVERLPGEAPIDAAPPESAAEAAAPAAPAAAGRATRPERARPAEAEGGVLDTLLATVLNIWFLGAAAIVLLGALFLARRRTADEAPASRYGSDLRDGPVPVRPSADGASRDDDTFIVEETGRTQAVTGLRGAAAEAESPLERTISTEGGVELDQADVIAEADFHIAYGLYDQAADLLTRALRDAPGRRDLRLKLLEVYFIWENKAAFLKEARAFRDGAPGRDDADWNKVLIMGKQLCPDEDLFAGAPLDAGLDINVGDVGDATSIDIGLGTTGDDDGLGVDLDLTAARAGPAASDLLDFDFGDDAPADATRRSRTGASGASTMETPTVEARYDSPTMETPTIESSSLGGDGLDFDLGSDSPTTETPTLQTDGANTLETPTLESAAPGWSAGATGVRRGFDSGADQTEEINLEDLGLDLTGLDEAAGDLAATGTQVPEFDLSDATGESSVSLPGLDVDSTAELQGLGEDADSEAIDLGELAGEDGTLDLPAIADALGRQAEAAAPDDTAEQPRAGLIDLSTESGELAGLDFEIGEEAAPEVEPTASLVGARGRGPEGPTMTEVGTKLDLARAYIDMGDPDGARSILNEVLEEGDPGQRQEARQLLAELAG
jgi:pilus assembly protein FimV